jgi:hypothetical protein
MFRYIVLCGALVLVSSCTGQESASAVASAGSGEPAAVAAPPAPPEPLPLADAASIAGKWDVVSFEGYRPRRLSGTQRAAYADFSERGVGLRMECNYSGRAGTIRDGKFVASEADDGAQTVMSCGRERDAREAASSPSSTRCYDRAHRPGPAPPALRSHRAHPGAAGGPPPQYVPTPAELEGRWRLLEVTHYMPAAAIRHRAVRSARPGRRFRRPPFLQPVPAIRPDLPRRPGREAGENRRDRAARRAADCRELAEPAPGRELPSQWDVLRLLHDNPLVEKTARTRC